MPPVTQMVPWRESGETKLEWRATAVLEGSNNRWSEYLSKRDGVIWKECCRLENMNLSLMRKFSTFFF